MSRSRHRYFEPGFRAPPRQTRPSIYRRTFAPHVVELWPDGPVVTIHFDADAQEFWASETLGDYRDRSALALIDAILRDFDSQSVAA